MADNQFGVEARPDFVPPLIHPAPHPETMKIASDETEQGYVIINVADFDKATMKKYSEPKAS